VRVLLIYDVDGWAFHRIACGLRAYAPDWVEPTIVSHQEYYATIKDQRKVIESFDALVALSICTGRPRFPKPPWIAFVCHCGFAFDGEDPNNWRSMGSSQSRSRRAAEMFLRNEVDHVFACNSKVEKAFAAHAPNRVTLMPQGVNVDLFTPRPWREPGKVLTAGWCGQKAPCKGFDQVLTPLMVRLGDQWRWKINSRGYRDALSASEMVEWYRSLDLFVCTSTAEGGPLTAFEAAACGVPVLSTEIGSVKDWGFPRENGLGLPEYGSRREAREVVRRAAGIMGSWRPTRELSQQFRASIEQQWSWKILAPKWFEAIRYIAEHPPDLPEGFRNELARRQRKEHG